MILYGMTNLSPPTLIVNFILLSLSLTYLSCEDFRFSRLLPEKGIDKKFEDQNTAFSIELSLSAKKSFWWNMLGTWDAFFRFHVRFRIDIFQVFLENSFASSNTILLEIYFNLRYEIFITKCPYLKLFHSIVQQLHIPFCERVFLWLALFFVDKQRVLHWKVILKFNVNVVSADVYQSRQKMLINYDKFG